METYFFINLIVERFFTHEICVCAHLTQTRYVQRACAEMGIIMKKKTRKQKNAISMSVILLMLAAGMLTACSNGKTEETTAVEGTEQVEEPAQDDATVTEQDQENEDIAASENVDGSEAAENEGAEETETQSVVYEGIDMDSTLPGLEWIETFNGVIEEPKFVIFNDETNKKVIVENGQEVEFCETDVFAVFTPLGRKISANDLEDNLTFKHNSSEKQVKYYSDISAKIKDGDKVEIKKEFEVDDEPLILTATLVVKKE